MHMISSCVGEYKKTMVTKKEKYYEQTTVVEHDSGVLHSDFWHDGRDDTEAVYRIF